MRARIKQSNIKYFLRQEYGFTSLNQFFKLTEHNTALKQKVIEQMVGEFTGYTIKDGKLSTYNPYTGKNESLKIKNFDHVNTKEELLKELSLQHKTRMQMLEQSRKRLLELSKEETKSRDKDLTAKHEEVKQSREKELKQGKRNLDVEQDSERLK